MHFVFSFWDTALVHYALYSYSARLIKKEYAILYSHLNIWLYVDGIFNYNTKRD